MAITQYIGARYVPILADPVEWTSEKTYEPLTIVTHEGNSYTSRQFVPQGIDITNEDYWALTGNYNAQIEQYRRETAQTIATNREYMDAAVNQVDEWLTDAQDKYSAKPFAFDTVADMQAAYELLYVGAICHTNGFHANGDGGAAWYVITDTGTANGMNVLACGNLFANLVYKNELVPEQFGAYGNGNNDDSDVIEYVFSIVPRNGIIQGTGVYLISKQIQLPIEYQVTIMGGCYKASNAFAATLSHDAMFYTPALSPTTPTGLNVPAEEMKIINVIFDGNHKASGLYTYKATRITITACQFYFFKTFGVDTAHTDTHEVNISNCNFVGRGWFDSPVDSSAIVLRSFDCQISGCVMSSCKWGIDMYRGQNIITNCHIYTHDFNGGCVCVRGYKTIFSDCYFDSADVVLIDPWFTQFDNCYLLVSNSTNHGIALQSTSPSRSVRGINFYNCMVGDARSDTTDAFELVTSNFTISYADQNTLDFVIVPEGNVTITNPYNAFKLNNDMPSFIPDEKYLVSINTQTSQLVAKEADTSDTYYNVFHSGDIIKTAYIGPSEVYRFVGIRLYVPTRTRVNIKALEGNACKIYDSSDNFITDTIATLDAGYYLVCFYRNFTGCINT